MKHQIGSWTSAGFLVAGFWGLYAFATFPTTWTQPIMWTAFLSCPIAFASFHFHFALGVYWSLLANAATYALVGLIVENLRRPVIRAN